MQETKAGQLDPRTLRFFYPLRDLQFALSAFDFLLEVEADRTHSMVELRRFRCYLDAGVIAYCRPFTETRGVPILSLKLIGVAPSPVQKAWLALRPSRSDSSGTI